MTGRHSLPIVLGAALLAGIATARAAKPDLDYQRLGVSLAQLAADPTLGGFAQGEQARARDALQRLRDADRKTRPHALFLAEKLIDLAVTAAQIEDAQRKVVLLEREHDRILLEASRRDAEAVRAELERQRLQNLAAAEEAARLQAQGEEAAQQAEQARKEAEQAHKLARAQARAAALARKEASLAEAAVAAMQGNLDNLKAESGANGRQMTLGADIFAADGTSLRPEAKRHLGRVIEFVQAEPAKRIRIEGHADAGGSKTLARKRADAVRAALIAAGVDAGRISTSGNGGRHDGGVVVSLVGG
ncbi:OmpA/MotB domain-containing protein [Mizugakiibacter sediminis]|uniref:OmpA/MotB domain-containing protein n=1 Tax=Mizugakiibacter sediminis TaxID=1475481 RepID=A0A0K8QLS5_9GAMM|nr:OmpA family protein [Mizugakiibacter sediminis]GAP65631.1 OmpA/MotB domain-containing protein [Mizugakiibacter sediminis]